MFSPDGPEERRAAFEETYERDLDEMDVAQQLADDELDAALMHQWEGAR